MFCESGRDVRIESMMEEEWAGTEGLSLLFQIQESEAPVFRPNQLKAATKWPMADAPSYCVGSIVSSYTESLFDAFHAIITHVRRGSSCTVRSRPV